MKELVQEDEEYVYFGYGQLVDSFEVDVEFEEHDNDYQGDSYYLLRDGGRYGVLVFGWGSCSGCDALQSCDTLSEVTALRDSLWESVRWFDSRDDLRAWVSTYDFEGQWYFYSSYGEGRAFVQRLRDYVNV